MPGSSSADPDGNALYQRLLAGDINASANIALTYYDSLCAWLASNSPRIDPDYYQLAAGDPGEAACLRQAAGEDDEAERRVSRKAHRRPNPRGTVQLRGPPREPTAWLQPLHRRVPALHHTGHRGVLHGRAEVRRPVDDCQPVHWPAR